MENEKSYIVFADGACSGNPGPGGWGAIVYSPLGTIKELGGGANQTTNNKMELTATIESLKIIKPQSQVIIFTDSSYVLNGITKWIWGWLRNNWKSSQGEDVLNKEFWQKLLAESQKRKIDWRYCKGHSGIAGNERADQIAVGYSKNEDLYLYHGKADVYNYSLFPLPERKDIPSMNGSSKSKQVNSSVKPYYLSFSNGVVRMHFDWPSCERSTKGISGAKYKKVKSSSEESETLKSWGLDPLKTLIQK